MIEKSKINKEIFSIRLKQLMDSNDDTTYTLGEYVHLSPATISRYTTGEMSPKITTIEAFARRYSVNPAWLMGYDVAKEMSFKNESTDVDFDNLHKLIARNGKKYTMEQKHELIKILLEPDKE